MPKIKPVSESELDALSEECFEIAQRLHDAAHRLENTIMSRVDNPIKWANDFVTITRASLQMSSALITRGALDEQRAADEKNIKAAMVTK